MMFTRPFSIGLSVVAVLVTATLAPAAIAEDHPVLKLWPNGAPGEKGNLEPEKAVASGEPLPITRVSNVSDPTITLYRAPADKANGCAVVICPGGGYHILAWDLEGTEVAEWLNSIGVTAVLLKYRVPRRDKKLPQVAAMQDAQRAMRLTRQHATDWGIDADRIGILGFSAGGHLSVMTALHYEDASYESVDAADELSSRPDFLVPIYAAYISETDTLSKVTAETPPTFLAVTQDDAGRGVDAAKFFIELKKNGVPAELHVYSRGGHGYGLRPSENPVSTWPQRLEDWMRVSGLLRKR